MLSINFLKVSCNGSIEIEFALTWEDAKIVYDPTFAPISTNVSAGLKKCN